MKKEKELIYTLLVCRYSGQTSNIIESILSKPINIKCNNIKDLAFIIKEHVFLYGYEGNVELAEEKCKSNLKKVIKELEKYAKK